MSLILKKRYPFVLGGSDLIRSLHALVTSARF